MTLDEFQARFRAACDAHIGTVHASKTALMDEIRKLLTEAGADCEVADADDVFDAIARAEIARMKKALS